MLIILKKVIYIFLIFGINLAVCSYMINKISARSELRRGFTASRAGGLGYPFLEISKYLAKSYRLNIWEIFLFFFSFFIWTAIPFSQTLILIKLDSDLVIAVLFYIVLVFFSLVNASRSSYGFIWNNFLKKVLMMYSIFIPILFSISSLVLINRTLNLREIVGFQYQYWNIIYQPLGFILMFTSAFAQFKLTGLVRKNTVLFSENSEKEGAGFGRLITRFSNYSTLFFLLVIIVILYLAGWQKLYFVNGNIMFVLKFYILFFIILLLDKATPRLDDYKYLISINWKFLVPISVVNFILTIVFFILRNIYNLI
jgi:NADH:ubiquinone oxidoreductase subunit 1 (chain H)